MTLADRATIANMCPGVWCYSWLFPVDAETLNYMRSTGRSAEQIDLVEKYTRAQGLFRTDDMQDPVYTQMLTLDLATVVPEFSHLKRPQDRIALSDMKALPKTLLAPVGPQGIDIAGK